MRLLIFAIGAVANPFADPFEYRPYRLQKIAVRLYSNASYFDMERRRYMEEYRNRFTQKCILPLLLPLNLLVLPVICK